MDFASSVFLFNPFLVYDSGTGRDFSFYPFRYMEIPAFAVIFSPPVVAGRGIFFLLFGSYFSLNVIRTGWWSEYA